MSLFKKLNSNPLFKIEFNFRTLKRIRAEFAEVLDAMNFEKAAIYKYD